MTSLIAATSILLFAFAFIVYCRHQEKKAQIRLQVLVAHTEELEGNCQQEAINWAESSRKIKYIGDRLGQAGFINTRNRQLAIVSLTSIGLLSTVLGFYIGANSGGFFFALLGVCVGAYFGLMLGLYFLRFCKQQHHRKVVFQIPLTIESLIILVESGLGIIPALERLVATEAVDKNSNTKQANPVLQFFQIVYDLASHGIPFAQALQLVADATELQSLRHILLHLDISGTEGGEIVPSLRSLADHTATEWRLSVEQRVKRLENMVVFPVFTAVIGLMFLTAAVPMVPVIEFKDSLAKGQTTVVNASGVKSVVERSR